MTQKLLWKDRTRILGMPITFTRYRLFKDKLVHSKGLLFVQEGEFLLYRVMDVEIKYSLLDRLLGVGTIILFGADMTDRQFVIKQVKHPRRVLAKINELVEEERTRLGIKGKELFGSTVGIVG